ncbi:MAG TPA: flippase [Candidatus Dormibacteraeota bacterium]
MDEAQRGARARVQGMGSLAIRNTALVLTARVASRLLALVTVIATGNHLGADHYGQFQTVVNYTALVAVLVDLGFNTLYVREGARHPGELSRYLNNVLSSKALLALLGLLVLSLALGFNGLGSLIAAGFALMVLTTYSNLLRNTLYALQNLTYEAVAIVLEAVVLLGLVILGIRTHQGVAYFLWAYAGSYAFSCAYFVTVLGARRMVTFGVRLEWTLIRRWFWSGLPFALTFVITTIYFKIDQPLLYALRPHAEAGWYGFAYKPFESLLFIPQSMLAVVFPVMSVYYHQAKERLQPTINLFFKALVLLGWPLTVGTVVLAHGLNGLLHLYPQSEPALRILALGIVFMFASNTFIAALNAIDRQVLFTWAAAASMVVNVALNAALIPFYGYIGSSWATVVTEVVLLAAAYVMVGRELYRAPLHRLAWKPLLAGLVMGGAIWPFHQATGWTTLLVILLGGAVYLAAAFLLRALDPPELALARSALRRDA